MYYLKQHQTREGRKETLQFNLTAIKTRLINFNNNYNYENSLDEKANK